MRAVRGGRGAGGRGRESACRAPVMEEGGCAGTWASPSWADPEAPAVDDAAGPGVAAGAGAAPIRASRSCTAPRASRTGGTAKRCQRGSDARGRGESTYVVRLRPHRRRGRQARGGPWVLVLVGGEARTGHAGGHGPRAPRTGRWPPAHVDSAARSVRHRARVDRRARGGAVAVPILRLRARGERRGRVGLPLRGPLMRLWWQRHGPCRR